MSDARLTQEFGIGFNGVHSTSATVAPPIVGVRNDSYGA